MMNLQKTFIAQLNIFQASYGTIAILVCTNIVYIFDMCNKVSMR